MALYEEPPGGNIEARYHDGRDPQALYRISQAPQSARVQLEKALDVLIRQRWIILLVFVICFAGAMAISYVQIPEYEAYSSILVDLGNRKPSTEGLSVRAQDPFARNDRSLDAELFIIQSSNTIAERVAERLLAARDTASRPLELTILQTENGALTHAPSIAMRLRGYVDFSPARPGMNILFVRATSQMPYEATLIANLYAEEYIRLTQEASRTHVTTTREFLESQEYELREELRQAEDAVREFLQERGASGMEDENRSLLGHIAELEANRDRVSIDLMTRRSTLASIQQTLSRVQPDLVTSIASSKSQKIKGLQQQIAELDLARTQILMQYIDRPDRIQNEPELIRIQNQLDELQDQVQTLSKDYVSEVVNAGGISGGGGDLAQIADLRSQVIRQQIEISGLETQLKVIEDRIKEREAELMLVPEKTTALSRLERKRDYAEQMYKSVVGQLQNTRLNEVSEPGYAQIIRKATVPFMPVRPRPKRNMLIGIFLGLFLGIGLAFATNSLSTEILEPEKLESFGVPLVSVIPDLGQFKDLQFRGEERAQWANRSVDTSLVTLLNPTSLVTEAYRDARTKLEFRLPPVESRTLLVTSPCPNEGKSVTAANLAIVMARAGRRTILVDMDLRRPSVHTLFGLGSGKGVTELYNKKPTFNWSSTRTPLKNLYVIPAGRPLQNPVEAIGTERTNDIIALLQEWFDVIIFDTPPVLTATETKMLAALCQGTILVARASQTREEDYQHAIEELNSVDAPIAGAVLNGFEVNHSIRHRGRYRYYSSYDPLPA